MTDMAKVTLSEFEEMLIKNTQWILTKHIIVEKAGQLLGAQVETINRQFIEPLSPTMKELAACRPRIFKGEKYRELPYVMLDYPAIFSKTDVFALRSMFWWGNFISVTLHLSGKYKQERKELLFRELEKDKELLYISNGAQEWEHHFEETNYTCLAGMKGEDLRKKIVQSSFIKIALKYDLEEWNSMNALLEAAFSRLAGLVKN